MKNYQEKIYANVKVDPRTSCWEWTRYRLPFGYGRTRHLGKNVTAHRLSWTVFRGPIPEGLCVCHRCDNPPCCNPEHLFLGTHAENTADAESKGRMNHSGLILGCRIQRQRKLTHAQVDEIKSSSEPSSVIAARMGCSYTNVYMIRRGLRKVAPRR